jgi:hypothetical protein
VPLLFPNPEGERHTISVSEIHLVVPHIEFPIRAVALGPESPKLTPSSVRLVPPDAAAFVSRMFEITGASNVKNFWIVPTIAEILMPTLTAVPRAPRTWHLTLELVVQDCVAHSVSSSLMLAELGV